MVDVFNGPRLLEMMPLLPPFYIEVGAARARARGGRRCVYRQLTRVAGTPIHPQVFSLSCTVLLMRLSKGAVWPLAGDDEMGEWRPLAGRDPPADPRFFLCVAKWSTRSSRLPVD
jgi:hypothetical protein